ncbi:MAG TPA: p-hydroxycinnamoyl CoA hydratase/lyase [Acidimicrobiia bacterium]
MSEPYRNETVLVEVSEGIAWITLNRPEKRNAMNPTLHFEMVDVLDRLETDPAARVLVITGAGEAWSAGQDIKEYFRDLDDKPAERARASWAAQEWRWRRLWGYPKPTIAMVNGYCFGGAFTTLTSCDLAIAAEEATFGLSEVNWGILPGGNVSRALTEVLGHRDVMYLILTGEPFDGKRAAEMGLVNRAVPLADLVTETTKLARTLADKSPAVLSATKQAYKYAKDMDFWQAEEYLKVKSNLLNLGDPDRSRAQGMSQFLDEKTYRPGVQSYDRAQQNDAVADNTEDS